MSGYLITGAAVWTGGDTTVIQDVVIDRGRIASVGADTAGSTHGLDVVDGRGCTILPGLIDAHVHLTTPSESSRPRTNADFRSNTGAAEKALHGYRNAMKALAAGVTTLRVIGHRDAGEVELRDLIDRGAYVGPRLSVAPWWVSMTGGHGDLFFMKGKQRAPFDTVDGPYACRTLVRMQAARGADFIKVMASGGVMSAGDKPEWPNFTIDELAAVVDEAHSLGLPVAAHAHSWEGIRRALTAGVDSIEHGTDLDDELRTVMVEQGAFLVPTLLIGAEARDNADPVVVAPEVRRAMADVAARQMEQLRAAVDVGVRIAFGTDTSGNVCEFGRHARELTLYTEAGMSPRDALTTATANSAELLGLTKVTGRVAAGFSADLVLVRGDPLTDIRILDHAEAIERIFVRGVDVTSYCHTVTEAMMP